VSIAEGIDLANKIATQLVLLSLIIVAVIYVREGKDERGAAMFNHFFRVMFILLSGGITLIIFLNLGASVTYESYRNLVGLTLGLSYIIGTIFLLFLRKKY
jgi:hypothetical protein